MSFFNFNDRNKRKKNPTTTGRALTKDLFHSTHLAFHGGKAEV